MTDRPPQPAPTTGPSRDMFGGPWLGVLVFVVIAIALGWGLISLMQQQLSHTSQTLDQAELDHGFDPQVTYTLKRDLLLGYLADGRRALLPGKDDLPKHAPGRRSAPTIDDVRANPDNFPDLIGIVERGTTLHFEEVIDDRNNPQTRILVLVRLLDGPYARRTAVLGLHLESADIDPQTGQTRYLPRADLFESIEPAPGPVQSGGSDTPP